MATGATAPFKSDAAALIAATTASAVVALPGSGDTAVITNLAANPAYVVFSTDPTATAVIPTANVPTPQMYVVPAGAQRFAVLPVTLASGALQTQPNVYAAVILGASTGNVIIERGSGGAR